MQINITKLNYLPFVTISGCRTGIQTCNYYTDLNEIERNHIPLDECYYMTEAFLLKVESSKYSIKRLLEELRSQYNLENVTILPVFKNVIYDDKTLAINRHLYKELNNRDYELLAAINLKKASEYVNVLNTEDRKLHDQIVLQHKKKKIFESFIKRDIDLQLQKILGEEGIVETVMNNNNDYTVRINCAKVVQRLIDNSDLNKYLKTLNLTPRVYNPYDSATRLILNIDELKTSEGEQI